MSLAIDTASLGTRADVHDEKASSPAAGSLVLRWGLRVADLVGLQVAWVISFALSETAATAEVPLRSAAVLGLPLAGVWIMKTQDLYLARVAAMRTVEHARILRSCSLLLLVAIGGQQAGLVPLGITELFVGAGLSLAGVTSFRLAYRAWLCSARATGRYRQPVVLVGIDEATTEIRRIAEEQPELGYTVVGAIGTRRSAVEHDMDDLWIGEIGEARPLIRRVGATGALLSATAVGPQALNDLTRDLFSEGCHIHLTTGITGLDQRRLRAVHLGYEPLVYLEPPVRSPVGAVLKRTLDLVTATALLALSIPVLLVSAIAIRLEDGGPVVFRQERVGRGGRRFTVLKLRTMQIDAEEYLIDLVDHNERSGPLFKMQQDPRVTRIGRVLRALSIDELPQLVNVLRGEMSMVGPRPALPAEEAEFTDRLRQRTAVLPGITGLWQVEGRDNPSFRVYERLDLFYVENWSIGLDLMIMLATVESELSRAIQRISGRTTQRRLRAAS